MVCKKQIEQKETYRYTYATVPAFAISCDFLSLLDSSATRCKVVTPTKPMQRDALNR
jgi:hypothetical protein